MSLLAPLLTVIPKCIVWTKILFDKKIFEILTTKNSNLVDFLKENGQKFSETGGRFGWGQKGQFWSLGGAIALNAPPPGSASAVDSSKRNRLGGLRCEPQFIGKEVVPECAAARREILRLCSATRTSHSYNCSRKFGLFLGFTLRLQAWTEVDRMLQAGTEG